MAGVTMFAVIAFTLLQIEPGAFGSDEISAMLYYIVPVVVIAGILGSNFLFKVRLKESIAQTSLRGKMDTYRSALIVKFSLIEGPAFLAVIAYLLSANRFYLVIIVLLLVVFWIYRPVKEKAILELELDHDQRRVVENPDAYLE